MGFNLARTKNILILKMIYTNKQCSRVSCEAQSGFAAFGKGVQVISSHRTNFLTNLAKWCTCHLMMISSQSWIEVTKGKALLTPRHLLNAF